MVAACVGRAGRGDAGQLPLEVTNIVVGPGAARVNWNAAPLQSYSVLAGTNFAAITNWNPTSVGVNSSFVDTNYSAGNQALFYRVKENINPNPRISIGKPTFGYTSELYQNTSGLVDGIFNT